MAIDKTATIGGGKIWVGRTKPNLRVQIEGLNFDTGEVTFVRLGDRSKGAYLIEDFIKHFRPQPQPRR